MGRDKLGVDCVGLVVYAAQQVKSLPRDYYIEPYRLAPDFKKMLGHLKHICHRTMSHEAGDVVLFLRHDMVHVGIITWHNHILHADQRHGSVIEVPFTSPWCDYTSSFWELK